MTEQQMPTPDPDLDNAVETQETTKKTMKPRQAVRRVAIDGTETKWQSINAASKETEIGLATLNKLLTTGGYHINGDRFYFAPFEPAGASKKINVSLSDETYAFVEKHGGTDFVRSVLNTLAAGGSVQI